DPNGIKVVAGRGNRDAGGNRKRPRRDFVVVFDLSGEAIAGLKLDREVAQHVIRFQFTGIAVDVRGCDRPIELSDPLGGTRARAEPERAYVLLYSWATDVTDLGIKVAPDHQSFELKTVSISRIRQLATITDAVLRRAGGDGPRPERVDRQV